MSAGGELSLSTISLPVAGFSLAVCLAVLVEISEESVAFSKRASSCWFKMPSQFCVFSCTISRIPFSRFHFLFCSPESYKLPSDFYIFKRISACACVCVSVCLSVCFNSSKATGRANIKRCTIDHRFWAGV